jgi:PleD family two-component response regulator
LANRKREISAPSAPGEADDCSPLSEVAEEPGIARPGVLWADDNADMSDYVKRLLGERYEVMAVFDGTTALAAALASPPRPGSHRHHDAGSGWFRSPAGTAS